MNEKFDKDYLSELIEASYALEDEWYEIIEDLSEGFPDASEEEDNSRKTEYERRKLELSIKFQKLADYLHNSEAFDERTEARKSITIDANRRRDFLGPDGVVPDDGQLNPEHEVDGLLALIEGRQYFFQVPVAKKCGTAFGEREGNLEIQFSRNQLELRSLSRLEAKITSDFSTLRDFHSNGPFNQILYADTGLQAPEGWIWVEGVVYGKNFNRVKLFVETLCQEIQGMLLAFRLAKFRSTHLISPPSMVIGSGKTYNTGSYTNSVVASCAFSVGFDPDLKPESELDEKHGNSGSVVRRARLVERLFKSEDQRALAIRQALRIYLRACSAWSEGEKAMFLATLLEGILLDRRKEDLSARLQDAVSYWVGTTAENRNEIKQKIKNLYNARSSFVHNGELHPSNFDSQGVFQLAQEVISKEILYI